MLGIVLGVIVIVLWGAFVAPKATQRLPDPARLALELVLFAGGTAAFAATAGTVAAILFGIAAVGSALLTRRHEPA